MPKFIHSFIHIEHLYSASSRKLLRSAPNTSMVKQSKLSSLVGVIAVNNELRPMFLVRMTFGI